MDELLILENYKYRASYPVLVDVGAHHGWFSMAFARRGWEVIAFEPEKNNCAVFTKNLSDFSKVRCISKAVSNVNDEKVPFFVSDEHYGIHSLKPWHKTHKPTYEVETVRLDHALQELGTDAVTLLKIDVEGADFLALQGFDFCHYQPEVVMIEFMDERTEKNFGYTHHDSAAFMKDRGYTCFVSEWSPVNDYAREGIASETPSTHWIQIYPYSMIHRQPSWGNLIFIPDHDKIKFKKYFNNLKRKRFFIEMIKKIPGTIFAYRFIKSVFTKQ